MFSEYLLYFSCWDLSCPVSTFTCIQTKTKVVSISHNLARITDRLACITNPLITHVTDPLPLTHDCLVSCRTIQHHPHQPKSSTSTSQSETGTVGVCLPTSPMTAVVIGRILFPMVHLWRLGMLREEWTLVYRAWSNVYIVPSRCVGILLYSPSTVDDACSCASCFSHY